MLSIMYHWGFQISHYTEGNGMVSVNINHTHLHFAMDADYEYSPLTYRNMDVAIFNTYVRASWLVYNDIKTMKTRKTAQAIGRALRKQPTPVKIISL